MINESKLIDIIDAALERRGRIDSELHAEHHEFVRLMIERERRSQELWEAIKKQVLGWGAVAAIGFIGDAVMRALKVDISQFFR